MQQYFIDKTITNETGFELDSEILHHMTKVLRKDNGYQFRVADKEGKIYLCELNGRSAIIKEELKENRESDIYVTALISLIKNDHFELCLQKLTELGVNRIVPYEAERSVVKGSSKNKDERYRKILKEASEQCLRNKIPELCPNTSLKGVAKYLSELNLLPYEKEDPNVQADLSDCKSVTYIIGPEGGFSENEVRELTAMGFKSISLGRRILRAETAAICMACLIERGE